MGVIDKIFDSRHGYNGYLIAYFNKFFIGIAARMIPEHQMPQIVKDWTFELLDRKYLIKIAYALITLLLTLATIEKLYGAVIINFFSLYKQVAIESLSTFVAIDRLVGKWKV